MESEAVAIGELERSLTAPDPLAPTPGPFFGTYEKDAGYYEDLEFTCKMIEAMLELPDPCYFSYLATW